MWQWRSAKRRQNALSITISHLGITLLWTICQQMALRQNTSEHAKRQLQTIQRHNALGKKG